MTDGNSSRRLSRRTALKLGAGTAAATTLGGLAGCSSLPIIGGGGGSSMGDWLVEPGELVDRDTYEATYRNYGALAEHEDELDDEVYASVEADYEAGYGDPLGVDIADADWELQLGGRRTSAFSASYSRNEIVTTIEEDFEFERESQTSGFVLLAAPNGRTGLAVGGSVVLTVSGVEDVVDGLETFVGAKSGDTDLFPDEEAAVGAALDAVDGDYVTLSEDGPTDAIEAVAVSGTLDGETTSRTAALAFGDEDDVDEDLLDEIEEGTDWDGIETSTDGRIGLVEGEQDTDEFAFGGITRRGDPATVVRQWLAAATRGNDDRVKQLTHSESPLQGRLGIIVDQLSSQDLTVEGVETVDAGDDRARVEVTITYENQGESTTTTSTVELRPEDGAWRLWEFVN